MTQVEIIETIKRATRQETHHTIYDKGVFSYYNAHGKLIGRYNTRTGKLEVELS